MFFDIAFAFAKMELTEDEDAKTYIEKLENVQRSMDKLLDELSEWIASPVYSPNHPFGEKMLQESKQDYAEKSVLP